jgi:hypothetical protein
MQLAGSCNFDGRRRLRQLCGRIDPLNLKRDTPENSQ